MTAPALLRPTGAPLPAFSAVVESIPFAPEKTILSNDLALCVTDTGLMVYRAGTPVCWIVLGYHNGQQDNQPKRCDFVDVAYVRTTQRGVNLETADFFTLPEALAFVTEVFGGGA